MTTTEEIARRLDAHEERLARLEAFTSAPWSAGTPERVTPAPTPIEPPVPSPPSHFWAPPSWPPPSAPPAAPSGRAQPPHADLSATTRAGGAHPASSFEDFVGGRILAWLGGTAIVASLLFLLVLAVRRGWLGEEERTLMAGIASLTLLAWGVAMHEHRGRTDAARAAAAAGIAGLFATTIVAAQVYELIGVELALPLSLAIGGVATALAVRWEAEGVGALGILGALASPLLVGAPLDTGTIALLWVVAACATIVVITQCWSWLALGSLLLTTVQWALWLTADNPAEHVVLALTAFGALSAAAVAGIELRSQETSPWSWPIVFISGCAIALGGWSALEADGGAANVAADAWLAAVGAAHVLVALAGLSAKRLRHDLALPTIALGVIALDVAFALRADGLALVTGWSVAIVGFAAIAAESRNRDAVTYALAGVLGHLVLATAHVLTFDAPLLALTGPFVADAVIATAIVAGGCFAAARVTAGTVAARLLDAQALIALAYLQAHAFDGAALTIALAATAAALLTITAKSEYRATPSLAFLAMAATHALCVSARPDALIVGLADPPTGLTALAALALATFAVALGLEKDESVRRPLLGAGWLVVLYAGSVAIVSSVPPDAQAGQTLLSAFWATTGIAMLVGGLLRDSPAVRAGAFALIAVAATKVFLFDLASLTALNRVASFMAFGILALGGAFAWQRIRPRPPGVG